MYRNSEGYADPTVGEALANIKREEKQKYRRLIYVCSPYAGDTEKNTEKALKYSRFVVGSGFVPVTPHLLFPRFLDDSKTEEREIGQRCGISLLYACRELWIFGEVISAGMQKEIEVAQKREIPIRKFIDVGNRITEVTI